MDYSKDIQNVKSIYSFINKYDIYDYKIFEG